MRKLLLLTAFVMSFAGSALAEGIPIKFTLDWKIQGVHGGSIWRNKRDILPPKVWM